MVTEKNAGLSDEVIIEIVHGIKDILIELIEFTFQKKRVKTE